jgi:multidrug efflux pump
MFRLVSGDELSIVSIIGISCSSASEKERHHDCGFRTRGRAPRRLSPEESIYQACLIRFRPIMMTTMAALFGAVPLAPHRAGIEENLPVRAAS